jgi:hypothetical protein
MILPKIQHNTTARGGFTLPAVMVVSAAVLTLAIGLLLVVSIERRTARSHVERQRAELAARAGMAELRSVLLEQAANDSFMVIEHRGRTEPGNDREPPAHLYLVNGSDAGSAINYRYHPLFSTATAPADNPTLEAPDASKLLGSDSTEIDPVPWQSGAEVAWIPVEDRDGKVVARYAYWVEDLQGKLDGEVAGNQLGEGGKHLRNPYPFPAPGLNPDPDADHALDRIALHALDPASGAEDISDLDTRLIEGRAALVTPGSVLAAAGFEAPFERGDDGRLVDPQARALEENVTATIQPYFEQPVVPWVEGIDPKVIGEPRKNLNQLLNNEREDAVDEMAEWIGDALPEFDTRKGGFPDNYAMTLAANALDYADEDGEPSVREDEYRGLDAYPLVSEFLMRFRWDNIVVEDGRKFVVLSATTYVELWNMSDQTASGEAELTYETAYSFPLGANPGIELDDPTLLDDPDVVTATLEKRNDRYWFAPFTVNLQPNEYRVYQVGKVTYKIDAGPSSIWIPSPLELGGDDGRTGYRMRWNEQLADQARGEVRRYNATLNYPSNTSSRPRQKVRTTVAGHSYKRGFTYLNNMGDPRISFYNAAPQDANAYPENYSPNRRNVRWTTIYNRDQPTKPKVYGRVLPSEWPDGGHDSEFGTSNFITSDERVDPDDGRFFAGVPSPKREEAPMRLSNAGRFYSVTELGRVYDPVMWNAGAPGGAGKPWPDVNTGSQPSGDFGGGNSLRIGRPEHPRFDQPGLRASQLLDLFHVGDSRSGDLADRLANTIFIHGHVNLNTATRDALRAMAAGILEADPALARAVSNSHETRTKMAQPTAPWELSAPTNELQADVIADAIIRSRPFASPSQLAQALDELGRPVFGNRDQYAGGSRIHWTDSAAEEVFARVFEASTVRSRNFRVWVIGQSLSPVTASTTTQRVLAESRLVFNLHSDPGDREDDGSFIEENHRVDVNYENTY